MLLRISLGRENKFIVFIERKTLYISGPAQFKPMLSKAQLHYTSILQHTHPHTHTHTLPTYNSPPILKKKKLKNWYPVFFPFLVKEDWLV